MALNPNFSIIIPNFNGALFLNDCLQSLVNSISRVKTKFEIILVDNASTDQSLNLFSQYQKKYLNLASFKLIVNSRNLGFAGGVNPGIINSKYPWVVLVNNDLTLSPNWFKTILQNFSLVNQKTAAIYGLVLTKDGKYIESEGLSFNYSGKCQNINNLQPYLKTTSLRKPALIWGAPASLVIYRQEILKLVGYFDPDFFAYEEDVDVALRLHKLGYQTLYLPNAISYHLGSGTSRKMGNFRHRMDLKNWIYIIIKNFSGEEISQNLWGIIEQRLRNISGLIKGTIRQDGIKSVYTIPKDIVSIFFEIIKTLPKMFSKRQSFIKLINSPK
jgi:GT2 family glycosyltransferase